MKQYLLSIYQPDSDPPPADVLAEIMRDVRAVDWSGALALVLHDLGRGAELMELVAQVAPPTPWLQAATAVASGDFERAAELYGEIGSLPDEAFTCLRAARRLLDAGHRTDAEEQLKLALAFCRKVDAVAHLREAMALRTASAS
jgi:hypothetical protein